MAFTSVTDNWEEAFPKVGECELPKPEVIVDELLLKGCIHVFQGMKSLWTYPLSTSLITLPHDHLEIEE